MTIEEIVDAVAAGTMEPELAAGLLHGMVEQAQRERLAAAALQGLLSTGAKRSSMDDVAREAFAYADCMVEASTEPDLDRNRTRETPPAMETATQKGAPGDVHGSQ